MLITNKGWLTGLALLLSASSVNAVTDNEFVCGALEASFGPFDYRVTPIDRKQLVEGAHFTREVELLIRGNASGKDPLGDISYTLRVFPNHPRALKSIMEYGITKKTDNPSGSRWPIWCYFDRAIRFQPDDAQVRMLYGLYLQRKGKFREALLQLDEAQKLAGENANIHYNIGLIYLDLGEFEEALDHAHRAYALGFPLPGLRNRLKRAGKWREPAPASPVAVTPAVPKPKESTDPPQE